MADLDRIRQQIALLATEDRVTLARWLVETLPDGVTLLSERTTLVDIELQRDEVPMAIAPAR